jgi:hypothetical protein
MCEKPILAQFGVSSHLSRRATLAEVSITDPLRRDVISRSPAYKEKMLQIRQPTRCVNCIAVPYMSLSAVVKRLLHYIVYLLPHIPARQSA